MPARIAALLDLAFERGHGTTYHQAYARVREEAPSPLFFYEIVLQEGQRWEELVAGFVPSLARVLKGKRRSLVRAEGIVVTFFVGERFYMIRGRDLMAFLRGQSGLDEATFVRALEEMAEPTERSEHQHRPPLALPGLPPAEEP